MMNKEERNAFLLATVNEHGAVDAVGTTPKMEEDFTKGYKELLEEGGFISIDNHFACMMVNATPHFSLVTPAEAHEADAPYIASQLANYDQIMKEMFHYNMGDAMAYRDK